MARYCTYDNPQSHRREGWCDGRVENFINFEILEAYGVAVGDAIVPGQVWGDPHALLKETE